MNISNHRLDGVPFKASPNHGGLLAGGRPDAIIIHYTAGLSAQSSVSWLCNPQAKASAHVVIGRDGKITQLVPFDIVAWHAGKSSFGGRSGYNQFSIGIELDNPGRLVRTEDGRFMAFGRRFEAEHVLHARHRNESSLSYWLDYPEAQIEAAFELCEALCGSYPIREILGHEEIAPGRKSDPGPAFPLELFRRRLVERDRSEDGADDAPPSPTSAVGMPPPVAAIRLGLVTASKLNIRTSPRADAPLAAPALVRGTVLTLAAEQHPGWLRASVRERPAVNGWVKAEYVRT